MNRSIQKAIASLVTHANLLENYHRFRDEIISKLNLNRGDASTLDSFYEFNKNRLIASARILKKNRWDDIKASLPIIVNYLNSDVLDNIWENYLSNLKIKDNPPKNPLSESILFALFAEKSPSLNLIEKQVVKYERIRNEVTYRHHENFVFHTPIVSNLVGSNNLDNLFIYIHECYRIENFNYNIPAIIDRKNTNHSQENNMVLFFKNLKKEGIGTLSLSSDVKNIIEKTIFFKSLSRSYDLFKEKLSQNDFLNFFKNLEQLGVWIIQKREG